MIPTHPDTAYQTRRFSTVSVSGTGIMNSGLNSAIADV